MNKKAIILVVLGVLVVGGAAWYFSGPKKVVAGPTPQEFYAFDKEKCPGESRSMKMDDVYMRGLLEIGEIYTAKMNWYKCNEVAKEDIVLYRFSGNKEPVVRRVVAAPGDKIKVTFEKPIKGWTLSVNEEIVTDGQNPYFFGGELPPPLKLYEQANKGQVGAAEVILFSSFPPGANDSGTFGAIAVQDIVAKVEKASGEVK